MSLALIAGRGALPTLVAKAQAQTPFICALHNTPPETLVPDLTFRLETFGTLLVQLAEAGITEVCLAGGIDRPILDPSALDEETAPLVPLFQEALSKGDDGALKIIVDLFERTGFTVRGAHELVPELLAEGGVYSDAWPDAQMRADADVGAAHIASVGPQDIGQACIVIGNKVIAMEDASGTDALITRLAPFSSAKRGILFKGPKPDQTRKVDLPTIGPDTIDAAGRAGLVAVIVDAGDVMVLDKTRSIALADHHGLVFWARTGE